MVKRRKAIRLGGADRAYVTVIHILLFLMLMVMLYPFVITISTSISDSPTLARAGAVYLLPAGFSWSAYTLLLRTTFLYRYYGNTIFYALASTVCMNLICITAAYPLSRKELPFKRFLTLCYLIPMFLSGGLVPYYLTLKSIGLIDSVLVMILPAALAIWNIIVMKSFFQQLPAELSESAFMDGAGDFTVMMRIIVPLSKPVIATFSVFHIVAVWNDFFTALMFLKNTDLYPMQLYLRGLLLGMETSSSRVMSNGLGSYAEYMDARTVRAAIVVITVLPIACMYPFFQKYFAKGMLVGSIKG